MAEFNRVQAIVRYTALKRGISAGAYDKRDENGNYGADGIEREIDNLRYQANEHSLDFHWHQDTKTCTLEPMNTEDIEAFKAATREDGQL
jgi:hypothetical protein